MTTAIRTSLLLLILYPAPRRPCVKEHRYGEGCGNPVMSLDGYVVDTNDGVAAVVDSYGDPTVIPGIGETHLRYLVPKETS